MLPTHMNVTYDQCPSEKRVALCMCNIQCARNTYLFSRQDSLLYRKILMKIFVSIRDRWSHPWLVIRHHHHPHVVRPTVVTD